MFTYVSIEYTHIYIYIYIGLVFLVKVILIFIMTSKNKPILLKNYICIIFQRFNINGKIELYF